MTDQLKTTTALALVVLMASSYAIGAPVSGEQDGGHYNPYSKSPNAQTEKQKYRESYYNCVAASGGVTANILDCSSNEASFQDSRLNAAYKTLQAKLTTCPIPPPVALLPV